MSRISTTAKALIYSLLIASLLVCFSDFAWGKAEATWIPLTPVGGKAIKANLLESDFDHIRLEVQIPGIWSQALATEVGDFTMLSILDGGPSTVIGEPNLPVITRMVQIPFGAEVSLNLESFQVVEKSLSELGITDEIAPVQSPVPKIQGAWEQAEFVINREAYQKDAFLPEERIKLGQIGVIRGHRFATILINPVSYNPQRGKVRIYWDMSIRITLSGSDMVQTQNQLYRYASAPFEELSRELFVNYPTYAPIAKDAPPLPMGYLIITHEDLYDDLTPLVEWKTQKGFHVTLAEVPQIGTTTEAIKAYIQNAYDNWDIPPTYLLFVGDSPDIPAWSGNYSSGAPTDVYYATMDTPPDSLPDIFRGRLPANNTTELNAMLSKILYYENPSASDLDWMGKMCFVASNDAGLTAEFTHRFVIENYVSPNGVEVDSIWERLGGSTQDITDCVNGGTSVLCYSGHGSTTGWGCVPFNQTNVNNLLNQDEYPLVCSHACLTAKFTLTECYGETWAQASNKGGIAFWGATNLSYWGEDDILEKRMFEAAFEDTCHSIGNMTDRALYRLFQHYGGSGLSMYYLDIYNVLGDPSIDLWTYPAESLFVEFPSNVKLGSNTTNIVVQTLGGSPIFGALVCLYKEGEVFETGYTDAAGQVTLYPNPISSGEVGITVTAHNTLPFMDGMEIGTKVGDVTYDGDVNLGDVIFLLNYLYRDESAPDPLSLGDVNCDSDVNLGDVIYLINYLYKEGPEPCSP